MPTRRMTNLSNQSIEVQKVSYVAFVIEKTLMDKFHKWPGFQVFSTCINRFFVRFEISTEVKFHVVVFRIATPCNVVLGYRRFGGPCCLHLQGKHEPLERRCPTTTLHCVTT